RPRYGLAAPRSRGGGGRGARRGGGLCPGPDPRGTVPRLGERHRDQQLKPRPAERDRRPERHRLPVVWLWVTVPGPFGGRQARRGWATKQGGRFADALPGCQLPRAKQPDAGGAADLEPDVVADRQPDVVA